MLNSSMFKTKTYLRLRFKTVQKKIKEGKNKALYRVAGLIRTTAKHSMRKRPGPSQAGSPPHAHTRTGLRVINFVVDQARSSAIVGPMKFPSSNFFNEPVPHIQEFGATVAHRRKYYTYPERSFMGWTLKKLTAEGKIPRQFSVYIGRAL